MEEVSANFEEMNILFINIQVKEDPYHACHHRPPPLPTITTRHHPRHHDDDERPDDAELLPHIPAPEERNETKGITTTVSSIHDTHDHHVASPTQKRRTWWNSVHSWMPANPKTRTFDEIPRSNALTHRNNTLYNRINRSVDCMHTRHG